MSDPRQALILIHGIGEQRPMETLRDFVDNVLDRQAKGTLVGAKYYNKPDFLSNNFELRRLVSAGGRGDRTDFYEFYWAYLMPTAAWDKLAGWYWVLMYRRWKNVPGPIRPVWLVSWATLLLALAIGFNSSIRFLLGHDIASGTAAKLPWLILATLGLASAIFRSYAGDAAVYLSPAPPNIEARQKIRAAGLDLLDKVVGSGRYDRIIVVGHSLGSVIGYDVLTLAWQRHSDAVRARLSAAWAKGELPDMKSVAIGQAEALAKAIRDADPADTALQAQLTADWRRATWAVADEQRANGDPWPVTDFVTLGSPLTYGALLLAANAEDFGRRTGELELPHCPPARELTKRFSFKHRGMDKDGRPQRATVLNSGALFAATAWTNLYFPCSWILKGDYIGGPVAPMFWGGVRDVAVATRIWGGWLAHTHYWQRNPRDTDPATAPLVRLREAIDLGRERPWPPTAPAPAAGPVAVTAAAAPPPTAPPDPAGDDESG